jgi:hypothetical protein
MTPKGNHRDLPKGAQIPGSKYYRWYCERCGVPLRVTLAYSEMFRSSVPGQSECEECSPKPMQGSVCGGSNTSWVDDCDAAGSWSGVVRAYEDNG